MTPSYQKLADAIRVYNPEFDEILLKKAYEFGELAHKDQARASGEPYFNHPCEVGIIVATELKLDLTAIIVALLHDVVEDTPYTVEDIRERFGNIVAENVVGVTKLSKRYFSSPSAQQASNFRKMIIAMARDIRVILVKLCDRLHNMRTLSHLREDKQVRIAQDTLEIYAPLAHRLGVNKICYELEDLSLMYLDPTFYKNLKKQLAKKRKEREQEITDLENQIRNLLSDQTFHSDIQGRPKHFYSIYKKMKEGERELESLYDLVGIRIVVRSIEECYSILGLLHTHWRPVPGRFKDYIAVPKSNGYQSLHTTLIHHSGDPFEVQIRTKEMHEVAESGIAAHWEYKVKEGKMNVDAGKTYAWLQQLIEWYQDVHHAGEFMNTVKMELFAQVVFCFTPAGDIFELPMGATPIDFAYNVHTEVGNRCVGAKVNGQIVPLDYELKNGDIIKILTNKNPRKPPNTWLNIAKTPMALKKIRDALKSELKEEYRTRGLETFIAQIKKMGGQSEQCQVVKSRHFNALAQKLGFASSTELFLGIGNGELNPATLVGKIFPELEVKEEKQSEKKESSQKAKKRENKTPSCVLVNGEEGYLVRISKCCKPIPGDNIDGFVTRGRGISIHRAGCPSLQYYIETEGARTIQVDWTHQVLKEKVPIGNSNKTTFQLTILVETKDKPGILTSMTRIISGEGINIISMKATSKHNRGHLVFDLEVKNLQEGKKLMKLLGKSADVIKISRVD